MKTFDLNSLGLQEMTTLEMKETDGGLFWFIIAAVAVLVGTSSCNFEINTQIGGINNTISTSDSTQNGWTADSTSVHLNLTPLPR